MTAKRMHDGGEPVGGVLLIGPGICPSQHGWGEPVGGVLLIGPGICPSQHGWGSRRGSPSLGLIRLPGRPRRGAFERAPSWAGSSTSTNLLLEVPIESLCALHASVEAQTFKPSARRTRYRLKSALALEVPS